MIASSPITVNERLNLPDNADALMSRVNTIEALENIRKRADLAIASVSHANCRHLAGFGWILLLSAVVCAAMSMLFRTGGLLEGVSAVSVFMGVIRTRTMASKRQHWTRCRTYRRMCRNKPNELVPTVRRYQKTLRVARRI